MSPSTPCLFHIELIRSVVQPVTTKETANLFNSSTITVLQQVVPLNCAAYDSTITQILCWLWKQNNQDLCLKTPWLCENKNECYRRICLSIVKLVTEIQLQTLSLMLLHFLSRFSEILWGLIKHRSLQVYMWNNAKTTGTQLLESYLTYW